MFKTLINIALLSTVAPVAFETKAGWKVDADGKVETKDGNPIYIDNAGNETVLDQNTVARLNGEAKQHRERADGLQTTLDAFKVDGKLMDPGTAKKAVETVGKLDAKQLIDAGEVDKVRETIKAEYTAQLSEKDAALNTLQSKYDGEQISKIFNNSEFVRNDIAVPVDMFEATFRNNFKMENGAVVAYDRAGNRLMSKAKIGEYAEPSEALKLLVDMHPQKDAIIKPIGAGGTGNKGGGGSGGGTGRTMKRGDFDNLDPGAQAQAGAAMAKGELSIVD